MDKIDFDVLVILYIGIQSYPIHKYIIFTDPNDTSPQEAVNLFMKYIDSLAIMEKGQLVQYN